MSGFLTHGKPDQPAMSNMLCIFVLTISSKAISAVDTATHSVRRLLALLDLADDTHERRLVAQSVLALLRSNSAAIGVNRT